MAPKIYTELQAKVKYTPCGGRCVHCGRLKCGMKKGHDKVIRCWCGCATTVSAKPKLRGR
jgi:hypothetical protein